MTRSSLRMRGPRDTHSRMRVLIASTFAAALVASCSSSTSPPSTSAQACLDTADAVGKAAQRCSEDYQTAYNDFVQNAANGSCNNITSVRDIQSLYNTCIPSFQTITCTDLDNGKLDATCDSQLVHN
jgi:hypothetical protein